MRRAWFVAWASVAVVLVWGCSGEGDRPKVTANDKDGGQPFQSATDASDGASSICTDVPASTCTGLLNCANKVSVVQVAMTAPARTGGTIDDGIYYLTRFELFTGPGGPTGPTGGFFRQTKRFSYSGTQLELVTESDIQAPTKLLGDVIANGTSLTYSYSCGGTGKQTFSYSVSADRKTLTVYAENGSNAGTYTRGD
jgi:hypothetical protein